MTNKNSTRLIIMGALLFLYLVGMQIALYILILYLFAIFLNVKLSSYFVLIFLILIPFCVYFKFLVLAEAFAVGAYSFFSGSIIAYVARTEKNVSKIIHPVNDKRICIALTFIFFAYNLFYKIGSQMATLVK